VTGPEAAADNARPAPGTLLIRADAGADIGMGHVMRCLALAQGWIDRGGAVVWATVTDTPTVSARLRAEGIEVVAMTGRTRDEDARELAKLARSSGAVALVIDGYHFDGAYQERVRTSGARVIVIDDHGHAGRYCADVVIDQNVGADERVYADRAAGTELLLGARYVLLRREFGAWRHWRRDVADRAREVLVTFGGSDPCNLTLAVLRVVAGEEVHDIRFTVVVGPANPYRGQIEAVAAARRDISLAVGVADLAPLMASCDMAIAAAGAVAWELAFMGVPSLVTPVAENQQPIAERLAVAGVAMNLGPPAGLASERTARTLAAVAATPTMRAEMARRGRALIDGRGVDRVLSRLLGGGDGES
jgi:UDP-2,4-diacetamido-2,4,6-trideoxy-beta-L-altropyranose hydrolase